MLVCHYSNKKIVKQRKLKQLFQESSTLSICQLSIRRLYNNITITYALKICLLNLKNMASKSNEKQSSQSNDDSPTDQSTGSQYVKSYLRISKDSLYMILALWMESFVNEPPKDHNRVGAVLVLPNDIVYAADCSRDGVHAVARLLMNHHDKAEGSKMFMSRKPCATCAKLLVQSKVKRVLFLPFEPEYYRLAEEVQENEDPNKTQMKQVDNLFTASSIALTKFVLKVEESVLKDVIRKVDKSVLKDLVSKVQDSNDALLKCERSVHEDGVLLKSFGEDAKPTSSTKTFDREGIKREKKMLIDKFGFEKNDKWTTKSIQEDLGWPEYDEMEKEVRDYFDSAMEWIALAKVLQGRGLNYEFQRCKSPNSVNSENSVDFDPVNNTVHADQARHFITMARLLSERTDDPKRGVGAVIVSYPEMEILSFAWNGFPLNALYGEFPRASDDDGSEKMKYPYVIHAEQNALLMRNTKNIKDAILFVTKCPCDKCTPLIAMQGIKTVVVDDKKDVPVGNQATQPGASGYEMFPELVEQGKFVCFQTKKMQKVPDASLTSREPDFTD